MHDDAGSGSRASRARPQEGCLTRSREPLPTRVDALPELPPAYGAVLEAGLRQIGIELPLGVRRAIDGHSRMLLAWTEAINLTAIREPAAVAREHVLDSLAAVPVLRSLGVDSFLDLGSGGGYPGLPLALALPARDAVLVDSIAKKTAFLAATTAAVGASDRIRVVTGRAEDLASGRGKAGDRERWPAVTARAVAALADLSEVALPLIRVGGRLVAWKRAGAALDDELPAAARALDALGGGEPVVQPVQVEGLEDHRLVVITKRRPTPDRWPRSPAERKRRPW